MTPSTSLRNDLFTPLDIVVIDTETTGLDGDAEICQLAAVDFYGNTLFNELVKPVNPISPQATEVHHITNEMVANCKGIRWYWDFFLKQHVYQKVVVGYNVMFDLRMLMQSARSADPTLSNTRSMAPLMIFDVMQLAVMSKGYSRWPKLTTLAENLGVTLPDEAFHDALYDCKVTAACFRAMVLL